jgi:hypothetical protein
MLANPRTINLIFAAACVSLALGPQRVLSSAGDAESAYEVLDRQEDPAADHGGLRQARSGAIIPVGEDA